MDDGTIWERGVTHLRGYHRSLKTDDEFSSFVMA